MEYFFIFVFFFSGIAVVLLLLRPAFISSMISRGDTRARKLSREVAHQYAEYREKAIFYIEKQLPLHTKNFINKSLASAKSRAQTFTEVVRNSRLLRKSDGISEFFKSISEVEKGMGEINEVFEEPVVAEAPVVAPKRKRKIQVIEEV